MPKTSTKGSEQPKAKPEFEYISRELSPPALLLEQLLQAHHIFLLHNGPSLDDLFVRLRRDNFCGIIERYWSRFARTWDVLLHGNPATDVFTAIKLSSGGELGFGVGEEEWGSGERDVLEDLTRRTEGMVDLVVSRFGEPQPSPEAGTATTSADELLPWMGCGKAPSASDGIIFGGVGAITRPSLRSLSLWMRQIYSHGEYAYGVHDNTSRTRAKRRRKNAAKVIGSLNGSPNATPLDDDVVQPGLKAAQRETVKKATATLDRMDPSIDPQMHNFPVYTTMASPDQIVKSDQTAVPSGFPGIPPPIVSAAEQALTEATRRADQDAKLQKDKDGTPSSGTTMGIPDGYMKYLTFGLSTFAKSSPPERPKAPVRSSSTSSKTLRPQGSETKSKVDYIKDTEDGDDDEPVLTQVDPIPDGATDMAEIAEQKRLENQGHFLVGLKGGLETLSGDGDISVADPESVGGSRKVIRTLHVETVENITEEPDDDQFTSEIERSVGASESFSTDKTCNNMRRLRVLVYVHRPFVYCLLFENRTTSLQYSKLYKDVHHSLLPIHKSLLSSTSATKVSQRIGASISASGDKSSMRSVSQFPEIPDDTTIYDLLYDPRTLSLHTSIPDIPDPGTSAAEGIVAGPMRDIQSDWTRVDAINVHSQILSTLSSVKGHTTEMERTSKTSRGWWVVWLRLPSLVVSTQQIDPAAATVSAASSHGYDSSYATPLSPSTVAPPEPDMHRIAFLVRKSSDPKQPAQASAGSRAVSGFLGALSLRQTSTDDRTGGTSAGWGPSALTSGIGIDARKYVEELFSLNR